MGIIVDFKNVARQADGKVSGKVNLTWKETIFGDDVTLVDIDKEFSTADRQEVAKINIPFKVVSITGNAEVFVKDEHTICVTGHAGVSVPVLGDWSKKLDDNCRPY